MLQARIVSARGSMYFASEVTPYDLENLRTYVRDFQSVMSNDVCLELSLDGRGSGRAMDVHVSNWLRRLAAEGVHVSLCSAATLDRSPSSSAVPTRSRR